MKINLTHWKQFPISDFFDVSYGKFIAKKDGEENKIEGYYPHITTTTLNNGNSYYVPESMFPSGCITVASDGNMGKSFYHDYPISAGNIVSVLKPKASIPLNRNIALFICSLIEKMGANYSWAGYKMSVDRVRNLSIPLPANDDDLPNWDYIERFVLNLKRQSLFNLKNFLSIETAKNKINVANWKRFKVTDIFDVKNTKSITQSMIIENSGEIPYVTASNLNNGVLTYISCDDDWIEEGNAIMIGGKTLTFTYQKNDFCSNDSHNISLYLKDKGLNLNLYSLFLITVLRSAFSNKYQWSDSISKTKIKKEYIFLPVNDKKEPDWDYMQKYTEKLTLVVNEKIGILTNSLNFQLK